MITVAVERDGEDAREFIEAAAPTHPSLIDTDHVLAERYNMVNVPTVLWIDERGRVSCGLPQWVRVAVPVEAAAGRLVPAFIAAAEEEGSTQ